MTVYNFTRFLYPCSRFLNTCSRFLYRKPRFLFCQTVYKPAKIPNLGDKRCTCFVSNTQASSSQDCTILYTLEFMQCITDDMRTDFFQRDKYKMSGRVNEIALVNQLMNKIFKIAVKQNHTMKKVSKIRETGKPRELFINTQIYSTIFSKLNTIF
jgi:hypothetical protein